MLLAAFSGLPNKSLELIPLTLPKHHTHLISNPDFPLLPASGNHHFVLCFSEFSYFRYFI